MMPTTVRDMFEAAADAFARPQDYDVVGLIEDLATIASESPAFAHEARRLAARLRHRLDA